MRLPLPTSPYSPRVTSILNESLVHQKVLHIYGEIGEAPQKPLEGNLTIHHDKDGQAFPPTYWPVIDSYFKALVHLSPGWNMIRLDFSTARIGSNGSAPTIHTSYIRLNYLPLNDVPPLQLVILAGKDSPCTFDAMPERIQREGNDLSAATRKFRMAAHLWQAFTAEQMHRNKFGRRCFRFEEEWQTGTLSMMDWQMGRMRNETKVHVVRTEQTVAELRALEYAQQYKSASKKGELYTIATNAIKRYFNVRPGQKLYVAALLIDAHWDPKIGTIRGHAALGGGDGELQLAIFGSQALQSYPSSIEEVVPAFSDCTRTDTKYVANDCNESGSNWEAANIGIGAHMHEVGHLFGCPHQESGVMLRDYVRLNRTFLLREPYSTRTKSAGLRLCRIEDECNWHRLDILRFRYHPCFRLPSDEPIMSQDDSIQCFPIGEGNILFIASTGIPHIEVRLDDEDLCKQSFEFLSTGSKINALPRQVKLSEAEIQAKLPEDKKRSKIRLEIFSGGARSIKIDDMAEILSKKYVVTLPQIRQAPKKDEGLTMNTYNNVMGLGQTLAKRQGFKSLKLGASQQQGTQPHEVILQSLTLQTKLLTSIKVYSGFALDGIEFCYEDGQRQLFGKRGGKPGGDEFLLDTRRGETILGFYVRAGLWVDGIEVLTTLGRRSGYFGNLQGGSA